MSARGDIRGQVREDERRRRDEANVQTLQAQIDEIRHLARELQSRQVRLEEQLKSAEAGWAQHRLALEQHRHEVSQAAQARAVEESRVRQQLSELGARIDDSTRPIRSIQAHLSELLEAARRQRDDTGQDSKRFDELRALIDHLAAHSERQVVIAQSLRDSIDTLRVELERVQRDLLRTDDGVKIVEQEVRRRVAEITQQIENIEARVESESAGIGSLAVRIDDLRHSIGGIDPQFAALRESVEHLAGEIDRFHGQARERDEIVGERVEEVRQQLATEIRDLEEMIQQRIERVSQRTDALDEVDRELTYRINMAEVQFEELRQIDERLRRELWYLHEQRARLRFEQAQHELESVIEARRDVERRTAGNRQAE